MPGGASALLKLEGKVTFPRWVSITITLVCIQAQRIFFEFFTAREASVVVY
jgi:general stress protein CsbA